jgi:hypothetical protein
VLTSGGNLEGYDPMMRRLANISGITFAAFLAWKVSLLGFASQPIPFNDSFFYDGPVVNYLLHGRYCNPSLSLALPISGDEVFCAYPPFYQVVLLGWMQVWGTSVLVAMWLHVVLLAIYGLTVLAVLRRLQTPAPQVNLAGLFLFSIAFHDRPDTLAHVVGVLAVCAWVYHRVWGAATLLLLTFCTSLQIGGVYSLWIGSLLLLETRLGQVKFPWATVVAFTLAFGGLVALVKFGFPRLWVGFFEHVQITPSVTGWRIPQLDELLRALRTAPGLLLVSGGLVWQAWRGGLLPALDRSRSLVVALTGAVAGCALLVVSLVYLTPNTITAANYLQPIVVASFLTVDCRRTGREPRGRFREVAAGSPARPHLAFGQLMLFLLAALLVSIRAVGVTVWAFAGVSDMSRAAAIKLVEREIATVPAGNAVAVSSPYLYDVARHTEVRWIHADWMGRSQGGTSDWTCDALVALKPRKLLLTQFDRYRRFELYINELRTRPEVLEMCIVDTACVRPPDSYPFLRRMVQHVSWAPVVVDLTWREATR